MNSGEDNFSNRELWDDLYQKFKNENCDECCKQIMQYRDISFPQPIPYIGPDFGKDAYCLMFVGIQTYGNIKRESCDSIKYDLFDTENEQKVLENGTMEK